MIEAVNNYELIALLINQDSFLKGDRRINAYEGKQLTTIIVEVLWW